MTHSKFTFSKNFPTWKTFTIFWQIHATLHGVHWNLGSTTCYKAEHFLIWKNYDYGIYVWTNKNILVTDSVFADNKVNFYVNSFGPNPLSHQSRDNVITVQNSLLIGRSGNFHCERDNVMPWHATKTQGRSQRPPGGKSDGEILLLCIRISRISWKLYTTYKVSVKILNLVFPHEILSSN